MAAIKINVYRAAGSWYGARWIDGDYDGCDALDVAGDASDAEAIAHAALMHLSVDGPREVNRVDDDAVGTWAVPASPRWGLQGPKEPVT